MPAASELPSGTVTFLFTDIEGSTRLLERFGRVVYSELLARHNEIIRAAVDRRGGAEVDRQGDAFFVVFRSPARPSRRPSTRSAAWRRRPGRTAPRCACAWD
jgi:class 3 adenylate cyclase